MAVKYSFVTKWQLKAPLQDVWDAIYDSMEWPQWWHGVQAVIEIEKNDARGINGVRNYTWKSVLPYKLTFNMRLTEKESLQRLKGIAFGELEGDGEWLFTEKNGIIYIQYNWNVVTTKKWMNTFGFLLKPFFVFSHNAVMHWGGKGLAKKLGTTLLKGQIN
jgi:hypothetical protein